jgi:hypothetical protein
LGYLVYASQAFITFPILARLSAFFPRATCPLFGPNLGIKPINDRVGLEQVKNKIMFYLWDSVFSRDKRPLESFLSEDGRDEISLDLYSDFLDLTETFMEKVYELGTADFIPF